MRSKLGFGGQIIAMLVTIIVFFFVIKIGINIYTNHGESVTVPNIMHKSFDEAKSILESYGLEIEVKDTGYVKSLPKDCILDQMITAGSKVKPGRIIFVTVNASSQPTIVFPDIIDNSSVRDATIKLKTMGFKVGETQYVPGEKDWVYGALVNGRLIRTGDRISVESVIILQVGDGRRDENDSILYIEPEYNYEEVNINKEEESETTSEKDDFAPVEEPNENKTPNKIE